MNAPQERNSAKLIVLDAKAGETDRKKDNQPVEARADQQEETSKADDGERHGQKGSASAEGQKLTGSSGSRRKRRLLIGVSALAVIGVAAYIYWDNSAHYESTDDAFVAARQFAITSRVAGNITSVAVTDNQHVMAGDVIARIDDRDYQTSLDEAEAQVEQAKASLANTKAQKTVQQATVEEQKAQVEQAKANLVFAQQQYDRYETLMKNGSGTIQNAQQYTAELHQDQAALTTDQASLIAAQRQLDAYQFQIASAEATVKQDEAQLEQAKLNLSYTTITAPQPGRVVQLSAGNGQYVQAGTNLSMFVPDKLWITANFKETQLNHMRPGQPVTVTFDAYPGREIHGHVASIQPGSGTAFSLLPAENATGNYVKIVQRVPVKITLDDVPEDVTLGPGMSVEPTVRVDPSPSIYERLRNVL
ncbi:HlyD family secretion protein [Allorhizobium sp. BGMRC 0089]|uniref:HlyD family secretion protein n=1 Tax=Allorhizobium sonneratiae TaxID=2934936 RepID=UPI002033AFAC|nr:HlyD family secretion protein [Allorhizobium sonneratiae]MCM2292907.1 HlyD family secretion protein [Allorhizobium sonneratiae]